MSDEKTTLFLRAMPRHIVREAKAAGARRGATLAKVVTEALERELHGRARPTGDDLQESIAWYETNRARLVSRYEGSYVAIIGNRVVDHDDDFEKLSERVFDRFGVRSIFMPKVEKSQTTVHVRSPRRAP
jgi:hypothetical protein